MKLINQDPKNILKALREGCPIACTTEGEWYVAGALSRLFTTKQQRDLSVARGIIRAFDKLETHSIRFGALQPVDYVPYIEVAEEVLGLLATSRTAEAFDLNFDLLRRIIALRYRLEEVNGGHDTVPPDVEENAALRVHAAEWKKNQVLIPKKELTADDLERIQETVSYSHFLPLITCSDSLRERFFIWTIRDKMSPAAFIQFPGMQEKIELSALAGRIGRVNGAHLKIRKAMIGGCLQKIMTLPVEGCDINILDDEAAHTFRGNYTLTVREIFEVFANKFAHAGNLEYLAEGIINWNYLKMGWYDAESNSYRTVNIHQAGWWNRLPLFEVISLEEARERFGDHIDGKNWNVAAAASRTTATLDYEKTHAYLDIAVPIGQGRYAIYDLGKFANEFPTTMKETLDMFALNVHASVAYPDESVYYSHREHTYYSFPMTEEQGTKMMDSIVEDIIISRGNNLVYQIESDNCAKWAQDKIEAGIGDIYMPNLFQMHLLATEPFGPVAYIFNLIRKLPKCIRTFVLTRLHLPLGANRGTWVNENGKMVYKSLSNHEFFETGMVYLPCYLHRQQEMGLIGRVMDFFERIVFSAGEFCHVRWKDFLEKYNLLSIKEPIVDKFQGLLLEKMLSARKRIERVLIPELAE